MGNAFYFAGLAITVLACGVARRRRRRQIAASTYLDIAISRGRQRR